MLPKVVEKLISLDCPMLSFVDFSSGFLFFGFVCACRRPIPPVVSYYSVRVYHY